MTDLYEAGDINQSENADDDFDDVDDIEDEAGAGNELGDTGRRDGVGRPDLPGPFAVQRPGLGGH